MTRYELNEKCWNIAWNSTTAKGKELIDSMMGWREIFYSTLVSWISGYLAGRKFYIENIEDDKLVPYKNMADCLHDVMINETNISLKKSVCEEILLEIRNYKGELQ